jgi:hypothetical protein
MPLPPIQHIEEALRGTMLFPALLSAALMIVACIAARLHASFLCFGPVAAIAAGLVYGTARTHLPWSPGAPGWRWLLWAVLAALAVDALARLPKVPAGAAWALRGMVAAQAGWMVMPTDWRDQFLWAPAALGALILLEWALLEQLGRLDRRGLMTLALVPAVNGAALVLIYAGSAKFAEVAMVLMATLFAVGVVALIIGAESNGVAAATAVLLPGLLLSIYYDQSESEFPALSFALAGLSPLALAPSLLPVWRRYQRKGLWAVQLLLVLIPAGAAILLAAQTGSLEDYE